MLCNSWRKEEWAGEGSKLPRNCLVLAHRSQHSRDHPGARLLDVSVGRVGHSVLGCGRSPVVGGDHPSPANRLAESG